MRIIDLHPDLVRALEASSDEHEQTFRHQQCDGAHDCFDWIVISALTDTGLIDDVDDETIGACIDWVVNDTVESLILKGYVEPLGMNEDGEMTSGLTQKGLEFKKG